VHSERRDSASATFDAEHAPLGSRIADRRPGLTVPPGVAGNDQPLRYVFILTYGRSGSTLLQGILCSIPGYLIRGENGNALYHLYNFHRELEFQRTIRTKDVPLTSVHAWFGIDDFPAALSIDLLRSLALDTVLRPEPGSRVVGFKEIRWWCFDWREYLEFISAIFPGARFIINTRNLDSVVKSEWWATMRHARERLAFYEHRLGEMAEFLGAAAYRVHYDDYVADPNLLAGLFDWLGEPFDEANVKEVMTVPHSI
jgi:hypothetical protein